MPVFRKRTQLDASPEELFAWHERPGAFERLVPPWTKIKVLERPQGLRDGARAVFRVSASPLSFRWTARHYDCVPGRGFSDEQVKGPFARWRHAHRFIAEGDGKALLEDEIDYALPLGTIGHVLGGSFVKRELERTFRFRHERTANDLRRHRQFSRLASLRVVVSGASGLVGRALVPFLRAGGHTVLRLVRTTAEADDEIAWEPSAGRIDAEALEGTDAVVHLAGENIAAGRWNATRKRRIRESRVAGTSLLARTLAGLNRPPKVLISASAVGFYGDRGDEPVDESSETGTGFLSDVCRAWEAAADPAVAAGIRLVKLRTGVVLAGSGGALARMLPPFRLGLGGVLGGGRQFLSWVALDDLVGIIHFAMATDAISGPLNAVAPEPVTNRELTTTLGSVLRRPTVMPVPAPIVRLAFGEMGEALLLGGARVLPKRLQGAGFAFQHSDLRKALAAELGRL